MANLADLARAHARSLAAARASLNGQAPRVPTATIGPSGGASNPETPCVASVCAGLCEGGLGFCYDDGCYCPFYKEGESPDATPAAARARYLAGQIQATRTFPVRTQKLELGPVRTGFVPAAARATHKDCCGSCSTGGPCDDDTGGKCAP